MHWELIELKELDVKVNGKTFLAKVRVEYVEDPIYELKDSFDFGNEAENKAYLERFENGELTSITLRVKVQAPGGEFEGVDQLSACHVHTDGQKFKADVNNTIAEYGMIENAKTELISNMRLAANNLVQLGIIAVSRPGE